MRAMGSGTRRNVSLRRAIQIDPNLSIAHDNLTWFFLFPLGRIEEAIREARTEVRLDPLSPMAHYLLAATLISAGRYDEAASQCEKLPADFVLTSECLGRARLGQGRTAEAIRVLATANSGVIWHMPMEELGGVTKSRSSLPKRRSLIRTGMGHFQYALVYAGMKDKDRTIDQLERLGRRWPREDRFHADGAGIRVCTGGPRVKALRKKVGLPRIETPAGR